jgi:hypothetical protein
VITNALLPSTDPASIIFDVNHERPSTTSLCDSYGIHTYILELAKYHQHIPLTLLTSKATTRLFIESSSLKFITHYSSHRNAAPSKCHLIDVSQFPAENSINIPDWHEAWTRYLLLLTNHASPAVLTRWFDHYTALREHPDFSDNWSSILAFDIEQRAAYAADPQAFNEAKYFRQFDNIKIRILKDENLKAMNDHFAHFKNHRFEPYPQRDSFRNSQSSADKSFRAEGSKSSSDRLPPLCLICGQTGHTFIACSSDKTPSGTSPHSKVLNKQLVCQSSPDVKYCVDFNIFCNGRRTCTRQVHKGGEVHACSLCGSSEHGACSRKCSSI